MSTTPEQITRAVSAAGDHHAYGWGRSPGSHSGPAWTEEQRAAYYDERDRLNGCPGHYRGGVRIDSVPDGQREAIRAKASELNAALSGDVRTFRTYREALSHSAEAVAKSGFAGYLVPWPGHTYARTAPRNATRQPSTVTP